MKQIFESYVNYSTQWYFDIFRTPKGVLRGLRVKVNGSSFTSFVCEKKDISATTSLQFCHEAPAGGLKVEHLAEEITTSVSTENLELLFQTPVSTLSTPTAQDQKPTLKMSKPKSKLLIMNLLHLHQ